MSITRTWRDRVIDPFEIAGVDVLLSAERTFVELSLGALIYDRALGAVERRAVGFALEKILPDLRSDFLEQKAKIGEHRIIAPETMIGLDHVPDTERNQHNANHERAEQQGAYIRKPSQWISQPKYY